MLPRARYRRGGRRRAGATRRGGGPAGQSGARAGRSRSRRHARHPSCNTQRHMNETRTDPPAPRRPDIDVPVDIRSISLTILAVGALILLLRYAQEVLVPIVLSILISYALWPIVTFLVKRLR